jgi:type I restriction-modification system DNA methylase subunit
MHHTVAEIAGELTNAPDDGFGAALDLAYQEIGAEIRMIFEESEHTAIDLDAQVREEVLNELDAIDDEAWESDEALGWVYQYFGEEEREEIDDRVDKENYKIAGTDIATKTQLFTPRYIVEWMVDNSLGRTWLEMQGERTNIDNEENCFYLAPLDDSLIDRETKAVENITVLDPACGSGHMLFYAFDVLYQMYLEQGEVPEEYIPREILQNNLYGIDIDSGAAQIAALSLYLKAKERSPDVTIPQLNIVSADAVLVNGNRKQEVLNRARSEVEKEILEQIWRSFDNIREFGSLVRVEERINEILDEHREKIRESGQVRFTDEGSFTTQSAFVSEEGGEEPWSQVKNRLLKEVGDLVSEALDRNDPIEEMFVQEVGKSVELLDLLVDQYEIVVSNPPYLNSSKMSEDLKTFTRDNYYGYRDLYSCFLQRVSELTKYSGYSVTITPETFMYLQSFEDLRNHILDNTTVIESAHLSNRDQDYMNVCLLFGPNKNADISCSKFNRVVGLENKQRGLNRVVSNYRETKTSDRVFEVSQSTFAGIRGSPFTYWYGSDVLSIFDDSKNFDQVVDIESGIKTGNNDKFLRKSWEIPSAEIGNRYRAYIRSENSLPYHDETTYLIDWKGEGSYIEKQGDKHGNQYFFGDKSRVGEECAAFQKNSKYFISRYVREGEIPDNQMYRVHPDSGNIQYINGWMNSALIRYVIEGFNPSANFQKYDVKRLPFRVDNGAITRIEPLHNLILEKVDQKSAYLEETLQFSPSQFADTVGTDAKKGIRGLWKEIKLAEAARLVAGGLIDEEIMDVYKLGEKTREKIYSEILPNPSQYPHVVNSGPIPHNPVTDKIQTTQLDNDEYQELVESVSNSSFDNLRDACTSHNVSPYTIINIIINESDSKIPNSDDLAGRILSYLLGELLGRWNNDDSESIFVLNQEAHQVDDQIQNQLKKQFGNAETAREFIESNLGRSIEDWFRNRFFRYYHTSNYKRRGQRIPVYWQLESPNGTFSCFLYYHRINRNTLPKLRGQYIDPRIEKFENELEMLSTEIDEENPNKSMLTRRETVEQNLNDIREFRTTIDQMIDDGVSVDVEAGIWENIKKWDQYEVLETGLPKLKSSYSR